MRPSNHSDEQHILVGVGVLATGVFVGMMDFTISWFSQEPYRRYISLSTGIVLLLLIPVLRRTGQTTLVFGIGALTTGACFLSSFMLSGNIFFLALGMCVPIGTTMCAGVRLGTLVSVFYGLATFGAALAITQGWWIPLYIHDELMRGTIAETTCVLLIMGAMCASSLWREVMVEAAVTKRQKSDLSLGRQLTGLRLLAETTTQLVVSEWDEVQWQAMLGRMASQLDCDIFANYELVGNQLHLRAVAGMSDAMLSEYRVLNLGEKTFGRCAQTQTTIYLSDDGLAADPHGAELWARGVRVLVSVPLLFGDQLVGILAFASTHKSSFASEELDFVTTVGQVIASVRGRELAAAKERTSELRFRTLVDCAADAFFLIAPSLRIVDVNRQACLSLGYTREELLELSVPDIVATHTQSTLRELGKKFDKQEVTFEAAYHRRKDGTEFPVEVHLSRVTLDGVRLVIALAHDTSDRKHLEEKLVHLQKMEAIGRLAGGVAHDFNNLLCVINSYSEILLNGLDQDSSLRDGLMAIQEAGQRGASLTRQLLVFSRKAVFEPTGVDVNEVVTDAERLLARLIGENITLETILSPHVCGVMADRTQLDQILINLAVNGRDAMPQGGKLTLQTRFLHATEFDGCPLSRQSVQPDQPDQVEESPTDLTDGYFVQLIISDTGCGMSPEMLANIFDPFFTTKGVGEGTGLGLAVVYGIVKQFKGWIEVTSQLGQGSSFVITFPAFELPAAPVDQPSPAVPQKNVATILLLEDELAVRQATSVALKQQGYRVIEAKSCQDALDLVQRFSDQISALVTDVIMPDMSGPDLVREIHHIVPNLPVLYMSGYPYDTISRASNSGEIHGLLQKPFSIAELSIRLHETLTRQTD